MNKQPQDTTLRVYLGGSWNNFYPSVVRAGCRSGYTLDDWYVNLGFRCALQGRQPRV